MKIEFYYDPCCPWCWITSRWLKTVEQERDIKITWLPFSLAIKNNELEDKDSSSNYAMTHRAAHRVHRVIEAIVKDGASNRGELYTAFGTSHFIEKNQYDDATIKNVLEGLNINASDLLKAADDESIDEVLQEHLDNAIDVVGEDVGVPLIIFVNEDEQRTGYFGPVITELPAREEALDLWDGLQKLASNKSFYELKRSRNVGPNVDSTKPTA